MAGGPLDRGARVGNLCNFYARMGNPRRVISGLLTVIVRNAEGVDGPGSDDWEEGVDDFVSMVDASDGVGDPYDDIVQSDPWWEGNDPNLDRAFEQNGYLEMDDPPWNHGWDRYSGIGASKAIGDYDCFLYHLSMGVNLQTPVLQYIKEDTGLKVISWTAAHPYGVAGTYPNVKIRGGHGDGAYAEITVNGVGWITAIVVEFGGSGYDLPDNTIYIYKGDIDGSFSTTHIPLTVSVIGDCLSETPHGSAWLIAESLFYNNANDPAAPGFPGPFSLVRDWDRTAGEWYDEVDHKYCQSFVKWSLLSRHNNAYDHTSWSPYPRHIDFEGIDGGDKSELLWRHLNTDADSGDPPDYEPNDGVDEGTSGGLFDYFKYGSTVNGRNARGDIAYPLGMIEQDEYCMYIDDKQVDYGQSNHTASSAGTYRGYVNGLDFRQGLTHRRKYVFNTGVSSWHPNSLGNDLSIFANPTEDHNPNINMRTKARHGYNRFFTPVHRIDIYATHPLPIETNVMTYTDASDDFPTLKHTKTTKKYIGGHTTDFYNLVVTIQLNVHNNDAVSAGVGGGIDPKVDAASYMNRTQILFQPFGETTNIRLTSTEPTV